MGWNPLKDIGDAFNDAGKELSRLYKKAEDEVWRENDQIMDWIGLGGGGGSSPSIQGALPTTPFKGGGEILNSQDAFRRKLAEKRSLLSTNQTGGVRGPSLVMRPTLFTL